MASKKAPKKAEATSGDVAGYSTSGRAYSSRELAALLVLKFDLEAFDDWLFGKGWEGFESQRDELVRLRERAINSVSDNNTEARDAWSMLLSFVHRTNLREEFLHPLALTGHRQKVNRTKGAIVSNEERAKLPPAAELLREMEGLCASTGCDMTAAKERMQRKYSVTRAAVNTRLRKLQSR